MRNNGYQGRRGGDWQGVVPTFNTFQTSKILIPRLDEYKITNNMFVDVEDDIALNPNGGQIVILNGSGFTKDTQLMVNGLYISDVGYLSPIRLAFKSPALPAGVYTIYAINPGGGAAALVPGLIYSVFPVFNVSGNIGTFYELTQFTSPVLSTSDSPMEYTVVAGELPPGSYFNNSNGTITGTAPPENNATSYTFTVNVKDSENQDTQITLNITISKDIVNWITPEIDTTYYAQSGVSITPINFKAEPASGFGVSYVASLPTGLTATYNTDTNFISGTLPQANNDYTLVGSLTATAERTNKSAVRTFTWVVSVGDIFWNRVVLSVSGQSATEKIPYNKDSSSYASTATIAGDARPNNFHPFLPSYSVGFLGPGGVAEFLSIPHPVLSNSWTVEFWAYIQMSGTNQTFLHFNNLGSNLGLHIWMNTANMMVVENGVTSQTAWSSTSFIGKFNRWVHVAIARSSVTSTIYGYIDGVFAGVNSFSPGTVNTLYIGKFGGGSQYYNGYLHNLRVNNGSVLYQGLIPSTVPLTAVENTALLTAQNPSLVDNSLNQYVISQVGNLGSGIEFSATNPFPGETTYSYWFFNRNGYLTIPSTGGGTLDLVSKNIFTIECWVYISAFSTGQNGIISNRPGSGNTGWDFRINPTGTVQFYHTGGNSLTTTGTLGLNTWYHLSVVRNGAQVYIYINGIIAAAANDWAGGSQSSANIYIGNNASTGDNYHQGYISNLRIVVNTALYSGNFTPPNSAILFTATNETTILALTGSTFRNSATANTSTLFTTAGDVRISPFTPTATVNWTTSTIGSAYFDTANNYLSLPASINFQFPGDFTIEGWMWFTNIGGGSPQSLISIRSSPNWFDVRWFTTRWQISLNSTGGTDIGTTPAPINNSWIHVACVRSGSSIRLYVNGVSTGVTLTDSSTLGYSNLNLGIGADVAGSNQLSGYISNLRIVKGTAVYTTNFTSSTTPLTATTGTVLLTLQYPGTATNNNIIDSGPLSYPVTKANNVAQGSFSPFSPRGWSALFNGTNDYYSIPGNNVMNFGSNNWTVEAWVYLHAMPTSDAWPASFTNTMEIIGVGTASTADGIACIIGQTKLIVQSNDSIILTSNNHNIVPNQWYHLAYVRQGNNVFFYVNGISIGGTITSIASAVGTGGTTWIGCETGQGAFFNGYISNLRVVNGLAVYTGNFTPSAVPLTATQISTSTNISSITTETTTLLAFQDGRLIDRSYNFSTISATNTPRLQKFSPFASHTISALSYSTYFNGATPDYIGLPTAFTNAVGPFINQVTTIEAWIFPTSFTSGNGYGHGIIGAYQAVAANGRYVFLVVGSATGSAQLQFIFTTGTGSQDNSVISTRTFNYREWTHVAVVIDATNPSLANVRLFINGFMETFTGKNFSSQTVLYDNNAIGGNLSQYINPFYGYISNLRWTKGQAVYTGDFTPRAIVSQISGINITIPDFSKIALLTCHSTQLLDYGYYGFTLNRNSNGSPKQLEFSPAERTVYSNSLVNNPNLYGGSYWFDQTGDTLTIPSSLIRGSTRFESGNFTIEFWAYPTASPTGSWNPMLSIGSSGGGQEIRISQNINGSGFGFLVPNGSDQYAGYGTLGLYQWHHFALVRNNGANGNQAVLYRNGLYAGGIVMGSFANTGPIMISYNPYADGNFGGYLSDIRIIKGSSIYNGSFIPPSSPVSLVHNTTGTVTLYLTGTDAPAHDPSLGINFESINNAQISNNVNKFGSTSMYFNGGNQVLYSPVNPAFRFGTGDFTIEAWVYPTGRNANSGSTIVGCQTSNTVADWYWKVDPSGFLYFQISGSNTGAVTSTSTVALNTWTYVSITRTNGIVAQRINGTLAGSTTTYTTSISNSIGLVIGGTTSASSQGAFLGYIADLRITKGYARTIIVPQVQLQQK